MFSSNFDKMYLIICIFRSIASGELNHYFINIYGMQNLFLCINLSRNRYWDITNVNFIENVIWVKNIMLYRDLFIIIGMIQYFCFKRFILRPQKMLSCIIIIFLRIFNNFLTILLYYKTNFLERLIFVTVVDCTCPLFIM